MGWTKFHLSWTFPFNWEDKFTDFQLACIVLYCIVTNYNGGSICEWKKKCHSPFSLISLVMNHWLKMPFYCIDSHVLITPFNNSSALRIYILILELDCVVLSTSLQSGVSSQFLSPSFQTISQQILSKQSRCHDVTKHGNVRISELYTP